MSVFQNRQRGGVWEYDFWIDKARYRGRCLDGKGQPAKSKGAAKQAETIEKARAIENRGTRGTVRAGDYAIAQAQAVLLKRVVDKKRSQEHVDNVRLWGDDVMEFFGAETPFRSLDQDRIDAYAMHVAAQTIKTWLGGARKPTPADAKDAALWRDTGRPRSQRQINNYLKHFRKLLAVAAKVRDPHTGQPVLSQSPELEIALDRVPRRKPRPMADSELAGRQAVLTPWVRDAAELSRLYGLRSKEALTIELRHIDDEARALFFRGEESKSGNDEHAYGGAAGWRLVQRLRRQAVVRGQKRLITWPGPEHVRAAMAGRKVPAGCWRPLKSLGTSWRKSAARAGVVDPHRFHDVRARYITEVAKTNKAAAKPAARHQDPATTDLYINVADDEVQSAVSRAVARRPKPAARRVLRIVK